MFSMWVSFFSGFATGHNYGIARLGGRSFSCLKTKKKADYSHDTILKSLCRAGIRPKPHHGQLTLFFPPKIVTVVQQLLKMAFSLWGCHLHGIFTAQQRCCEVCARWGAHLRPVASQPQGNGKNKPPSTQFERLPSCKAVHASFWNDFLFFFTQWQSSTECRNRF